MRRETILKSLLRHTMLTIPKRLAHVVVHSQFLNIIVGPNFSPSWSKPNFNCLLQWQTTQLSAYIVHSQLPTVFFLKSSNSQDHCFRAWRHSHSSPDVIHTPALFPIWGLLWQLWLSYPLHASVKLYPMSVHLN